jgi:hypothetical protein
MRIILLVEIRAFRGKGVYHDSRMLPGSTDAVTKETYFVTYDQNFINTDSRYRLDK